MRNDIERNRERMHQALHFVPVSDRETWVQTAMAIKSELGDEGLELWDEWSQQDGSHDSKSAQDVWRSIGANGKVGAGTLFYAATANGWSDDGAYLPPEEQAKRQKEADVVKATGEPDRYAIEAARSVRGKLAIPAFGTNRPDSATDFNDMAGLQGTEAVARVGASVAAAVDHPAEIELAPADGSDVWSKPQLLTAKLAPEPYPIDALPANIRSAVEEVASFVKAPVPLIASSALAAVSLATQAHVNVKRADLLEGPSSLFLLAIADSGERKSTCDGFFTSAIRQYQEEQHETVKPAIVRYEFDLAAWTAERDGLLSAIKDAGKKSKPTDEMKAKLAELRQRKPIRPKVPTLLLGDETPESLGWRLATEWPSAGVVSAEAGTVFGAHGMSKESAMRNMALLNILWDGGSHSVGRRTSEDYTIKGARLTIALQIQEPTLRSFFEQSGGLARGTGFLARFLLAWPQSTQGLRPFTEAPQAWPHLAAFNRRIADILAVPVPIDDDGSLSPAPMTLAPEAKAAWIAYHDAIEGELSSGGELFDVRDVASKSADNAARLAAIFQVLEHGMGGVIGLDCFDGASQIAAWHLRESLRFFNELVLPKELADASRLDSWLIDYRRHKRSPEVYKNHVRQHGPLRNKGRLDAAIKELISLDRVRLCQDGKRSIIKVNPALIEVPS